jgi:hypothetical protein
MKLCSKCKKQKDESEFYKKRKNKEVLSFWCKGCMRANTRERYEQKKGSVKKYLQHEERHRWVGKVREKRCGRCKKWKAENQYYKHSRHNDGLAVWCKECSNKATNKARKKRLATYCHRTDSAPAGGKAL